MAKIRDISVALHAGMPTWPGGPGFKLSQTADMAKGDAANVSAMSCDVHVGTHVDAPWHFLPEGATVDRLPLDVLVGAVQVAYLPHVHAVRAGDLESLALPAGTRRLLLRTSNSLLWANRVEEFQKDFVALTADAAEWVVGRGLSLIGVDYLSVQRFGDSPRTHEILLGAGVVVVEGLNLADVEPGQYELICLPLRLVGADGAPARAVLRSLE